MSLRFISSYGGWKTIPSYWEANFFRGGSGGYLMEDWRVKYFMEKTWFKTRRLIWYFLKILLSFNFPGVKILNTQMCFWDGKFLQGRKDVPTNYPIKKSFRKKKKTWNINVVPPWNFETTIHQMFKISESQMPSQKISKNFRFFFPVKHLPIYPYWWRGVFRFSDWVTPDACRFVSPEPHNLIFFPTRWW